MTRVKAARRGTLCSMEAEGHSSGTAECNYIVGALYTFAGYLNMLSGRGEAELLDCEIDREPPRFLLRGNGGDSLRAAWEAAVAGLRLLKETKPEAIDLIVEENVKD